MTPQDLIQRALEARQRAHAPYSSYRVGAALLAGDGSIFLGANVENASYGLTVCAERVAFFSAVAAGVKTFAALAVATQDGACMCGACRQVAREFAPDLEVHLADAEGRFQTTTLAALLPHSFGPESLRSRIDPPEPQSDSS